MSLVIRKDWRIWRFRYGLETKNTGSNIWIQYFQSQVRTQQLISNNRLYGFNQRLNNKPRVTILGTKYSALIEKRMVG
jgi:hypothetical protein